MAKHYATKNLRSAYEVTPTVEFDEVVAMFIRSRKAGVGTATRPNRPRSIKEYEYDLQRAIKWFKEHGVKHYSALDRQHVAKFVDHYQSLTLSQSSKNHMFRTLKALFNFVRRDEDCVQLKLQDFSSLLPRIGKNTPRIYLPSPETLSEFIGYFDQGLMWGLRDYVVCSLIVDCGLRIGEVCELTPECIKFDTSSLLVPAGKTGSRVVPVSRDSTLPLLQRWLRARTKYAKSGFLFVNKTGGKCRPTTFDQSFEEIRRKHKIGVSPEGSLTPHTLRHFFCTHYLVNGGGLEKLKQITGHTEISTLMLYVHLAGQVKTVAEEHDRVSPLRSLQSVGKKKRKMF